MSLTTVIALTSFAPGPAHADHQAAAVTAATATARNLPRTPWGDPDLQGTYTNGNESGIPMSRPAELAGKKPEDLDYILFNTMTPDHMFPGSGTLLGAKLGCPGIPAVDLHGNLSQGARTRNLADWAD